MDLRTFELFASVDPLTIELLQKEGELITRKPGEVIAKENDKSDEVFFIVEGRVNVEISTILSLEPVETIATLGPGNFIGEFALIGKVRRSATLRAKDTAHLYVWDAKKLSAFLEKNPACGFCVIKKIAADLADRLIDTNQLFRNTKI